jgi:hypothetical protein
MGWGTLVGMSDQSDSEDVEDPTRLREEVEQELDELVEETANEEADRMSEREDGDVDEPNRPS